MVIFALLTICLILFGFFFSLVLLGARVGSKFLPATQAKNSSRPSEASATLKTSAGTELDGRRHQSGKWDGRANGRVGGAGEWVKNGVDTTDGSMRLGFVRP
jgi:hypothetical protein